MSSSKHNVGQLARRKNAKRIRRGDPKAVIVTIHGLGEFVQQRAETDDDYAWLSRQRPDGTWEDLFTTKDFWRDL
jgi:hypothetical protein